MDIEGILERGGELYEAENSAYNRGDIVGMASAQQAMRENQDQFLSLTEPVVEKEPNRYVSMIARPLKAIASAGTIILGAISGAGIAKDLTPSLEDVVVYHSEDNSDSVDYGHQLVTEQDFSTNLGIKPLTTQSIAGYDEYNVTLENDCINFPERTSVMFEEDLEHYIDNEGRIRFEEKPLNWTLEVYSPRNGAEASTPGNVSFCSLGNEQYRLEFDNDLILTDGTYFSNLSNQTHSDLEEHQGNYETMRLNLISPTSVQFNRVIRDTDDNTLSDTYETYQIGEQVDLYGGNILTLDNISEDGAHFSQDYILNISENDFNEGNKSLHISNRGMIDLNFQSVNQRGGYFDQNNNFQSYRRDLENFEFTANFQNQVREEFPILGINEKKVIEDNSINEINIERVWSNRSQDYNVELDVKYVNAFGEDNSAKLWFNVTDGNETESYGYIPEVNVWIWDSQIHVGRWANNRYTFDKNMTLDDVSILGNETVSQRFVNGDTFINVGGSEANYTEVNNKTILNFRESILDRQAPNLGGFIMDDNGDVIISTDENYNISLSIYEENLRNVSVSLNNKEDGTALSISTELIDRGRGSYILNISIPKDIELNEYLLNITADDDANNFNSVSKRILHTEFEQPQPDLNSFIANYHDGKINVGSQFESDHAGGLELKIFNESGVEVFAKSYSDLNKTAVFSEEVDLQSGEYTAKLVRTENVSKISSLFREDSGYCIGGNGSDVSDNCDSEQRVLEEWPTLSFSEINSVSGNSTTGIDEVIQIKVEIDGQNYTVNNLQLKDKSTLDVWDSTVEIRNAVQNNEFSKLENLLILPGGKTFLGFETERQQNEAGDLEYNVRPHLWTIKEFDIKPGERPEVGANVLYTEEGTTEWEGEMINYSVSASEENGFEFVKALDDGSIVLKPYRLYELGVIDKDNGEEFYREEYNSERFVLANLNEIVYNYPISVSSLGQVEELETILGASTFEVWSPPVIPEPEPVDNNTNNTNETIPEHEHENNNTNDLNETETNETVLYVPRENELIVRSFNCDSHIEAGNPKSTRWDLDIINPNNDRVYITTNTGKVLAYHNSDPEHFNFLHFDMNGSEYLELRTLATPGFKVEDSEIMERGFNTSEFEKYGYSNPIRISIPNLDSCELINPLEETSEDNTEVAVQLEEEPDFVKWAAYSAVAASGVLTLNFLANSLKKRSEKRKEDNLGKWDATKDIEGEMDLQDLDLLAAGLNGNNQIDDSEE